MSPYPVTPEAIEQLKGRTTGWGRDEETGEYTYIVREPTGLPQEGKLRTISGVFAETPPEIIPMAEREQFGLPTTAEQPPREAWTPYQMFEEKVELQKKWSEQGRDNAYDRARQMEATDPSLAQAIRNDADDTRRLEQMELQVSSREMRMKLEQTRENRQLDERETYFAQERIVQDMAMPIKPPRIPELEEPKAAFTPANIQQGLGELYTGAPVSPLGIPMTVLTKKEDFIRHAINMWGPDYDLIAPQAIEIINRKFPDEYALGEIVYNARGERARVVDFDDKGEPIIERL